MQTAEREVRALIVKARRGGVVVCNRCVLDEGQRMSEVVEWADSRFGPLDYLSVQRAGAVVGSVARMEIPRKAKWDFGHQAIA